MYKILSIKNMFQPKVAHPIEKVIPESINDYNFASYQYKKYVRDFNGILGKRDLETAFGKGCHDEERYGQVIDNDFFKNNIGHNVIVHSIITPSVKLSEPINWRFKLGVWREKYKSGANLSKK